MRASDLSTHRVFDRILVGCAIGLVALATPIWGYWNDVINHQLVQTTILKTELRLTTLDYVHQDLGWALFPLSGFCLAFAVMLMRYRRQPRRIGLRTTRVVLIALILTLGIAIAGWAYLALPTIKQMQSGNVD